MTQIKTKNLRHLQMILGLIGYQGVDMRRLHFFISCYARSDYPTPNPHCHYV